MLMILLIIRDNSSKSVENSQIRRQKLEHPSKSVETRKSLEKLAILSNKNLQIRRNHVENSQIRRKNEKIRGHAPWNGYPSFQRIFANPGAKQKKISVYIYPYIYIII